MCGVSVCVECVYVWSECVECVYVWSECVDRVCGVK